MSAYLVIANLASMKRVESVVLVGHNVASFAIDLKCAILDATSALLVGLARIQKRLGHAPIGIAANNCTEESMIGQCIVQVLLSVVVANRDVLVVAAFVLDEKVGQTCTVRDEAGIDAFSTQVDLLEWVAREWRERGVIMTVIPVTIVCKRCSGAGQKKNTPKQGHKGEIQFTCCRFLTVHNKNTYDQEVRSWGL